MKTLSIIEPAGVKAIKENNEWEKIEFAIDSGASETVISEDMIPNVDMTESMASKRGVEYEVANGVTIPNEGEKKFGRFIWIEEDDDQRISLTFIRFFN